jgi:carbonic anhydrase
VILDDHYKDLEEPERLDVAIQENVLSQIENLHTHPAVATRMVKGDLRIHGWVYDLARGEVFAYDEQGGQFRELTLDGPEDQEDALAPLIERPRGDAH